jgi:hypothetical protein
MPRTVIPHHLIHKPDEVKRNAERFDDLCRLAEEVACPVVKEALVRETVNTAAEALTEEAKNALETLVEDAAVFEALDERRVVYEVKRSLGGIIPPPDEEECLLHSRELSQILISTWLESLRAAQAKSEVLVLSEFLLLEPPVSFIRWILERFGSREPEVSQSLTDAFASFALNADEAAAIMSTLRLKLFPEPGLVDLPFDLVLLGAPEMDVMAMDREYYQGLCDEFERQLAKMETVNRIAAEKRALEAVVEKSKAVTASFITPRARQAFASLSMPLAPAQYSHLATAAASPSLHSKTISTRVQYALTKH